MQIFILLKLLLCLCKLLFKFLLKDDLFSFLLEISFLLRLNVFLLKHENFIRFQLLNIVFSFCLKSGLLEILLLLHLRLIDICQMLLMGKFHQLLLVVPYLVLLGLSKHFLTI